MRNQANKKKWVWITGYIFLGGFLMYFFIPTYSTFIKYRKELESLNTRIKELEQENNNLRIEIKRFQNPLYIEKTARKELGMIKEGEIIYRITP